MRHTLPLALLATLAAVLTTTGCQTWDGHLNLGRYTTRPNYEASIRTVRVPVFKNKTQVYQGLSGVEKDLRTGEILSQPRRKDLDAPNAAFNLPEPGAPEPIPVRITSTGSFIPELGQSTSTARQVNFNRIAGQITRMMEKPW